MTKKYEQLKTWLIKRPTVTKERFTIFGRSLIENGSEFDVMIMMQIILQEKYNILIQINKQKSETDYIHDTSYKRPQWANNERNAQRAWLVQGK